MTDIVIAEYFTRLSETLAHENRLFTFNIGKKNQLCFNAVIATNSKWLEYKYIVDKCHSQQSRDICPNHSRNCYNPQHITTIRHEALFRSWWLGKVIEAHLTIDQTKQLNRRCKKNFVKCQEFQLEFYS